MTDEEIHQLMKDHDVLREFCLEIDNPAIVLTACSDRREISEGKTLFL